MEVGTGNEKSGAAESTRTILGAQVLRNGTGYGGNGGIERRREKVS